MARATRVALPPVAMWLLLAGESAEADNWQWLVAPYLWGASTAVDVSLNDDPVFGGDVSFPDLLDKLDLALQLHAEATKGRFGLLFDVTYLEISDHAEADVLPGLPGTTSIATGADLTMFEAAAFYRPSAEAYGLDVLLGLRVIDVGLDVEVTPPQPLEPRPIDGSQSLTDGLIGVRYSAPLGEKWFGWARADVGAGDTDGSLNLQAGVGVAFGDTGRYNLLLAYRHFFVEMEQSQGLVSVGTEVTMSGPAIGFAFRF